MTHPHSPMPCMCVCVCISGLLALPFHLPAPFNTHTHTCLPLCTTLPACTGVLLPRTAIAAAASMCAAAGAWLVLDNTYEDFVYDAEAREELAQPLVAGPNVVHVFSFSKVQNNRLPACLPARKVGLFCTAACCFPLNIYQIFPACHRRLMG